MKIITKRLQMRLIAMTDLEAIHELHALPETDEFNALGIPENIAATKAVITPWILENQQAEIRSFTFAIEQLVDHKFIGLAGLKLGSKKYRRGEIWYKLDVAFWRKGFGTEAVNSIIHYGFETLDLHRIEAGCAVDNIGSIKILEKVGMTREGRKRKVLPLKSGWSDNFEYAMLETDERLGLG